ncbi:MAG: hypothetical protein MUF21_08630 [Gemmatimonadaceae bacterium]|nr:hypothetical protein [Gemmatimonadaceae bacterium]
MTVAGSPPRAGDRGAARGPLVTPSRVAAAEMLAAMRGGMLLDMAFDRVTRTLDPRDRRWVQELVWGVLRRRAWYDAVLAARITGGLARLDADLADLLRLGVHQLMAMGSVPAYAAIAQTVELAKRRHGVGASKLANAVLRRIDREREMPGVASAEGAAAALPPDVDATERLAVRTSHPRWLLERWLRRWSREEVEALCAWDNVEAPVIVRPFGVTVDALRAMLAERDVHAAHAPLVDDALVLPPGVQLTELGPFQRGQLWVQDPGSALVVRWGAFARGTRVADLCAAPGGKTLALLQAGCDVLAADRSDARLDRLRDNLARVQRDDVPVRVLDATEPAIDGVDAVLVDVPCTGTGTLRRHPDARWRLRMSDVAVLPVMQRDILRGAASAVRPGGMLLYSTCSLETEENDDVVASFLAAHPDFVLEAAPDAAVPDAVRDVLRPTPGLPGADGIAGSVLRVLPQRHGADGAFAARLRKRGG